MRLAKGYGKITRRGEVRSGVFSDARSWIWLSLCLLLAGLPLAGMAQSQAPAAVQAVPSAGNSTATPVSAEGQQPVPQVGTISGTVEDQSGAVNVGAHVRLLRDGQPWGNEVLTGTNGEFSFTQVPPGPFRLTVTATGFVTEEVPGELHAGEFFLVPLISLSVSGGETVVRVGGSTVEVAQEQVDIEIKQRVFGIIPNFYVNYDPDPAPLNARQKFKLAWKSTTDPVTIAGGAFLAGLQQAADQFSGYGQGMQGYGKRFGAAYADIFSGTFIGSAVFPSLLKQDPRYFYRGTGSTGSRLGYALANAVICKGDNKRWQPNYSLILGSFAAGGISYLYYPASDRSAGLLVGNAFLKLGESSLAGVVQEFVVRRLTSRRDRH